MHPISFERRCRKRITATDTIFNRAYAGVSLVTIGEFHRNGRIFTEVIARTDKPVNS